MRPILIRRGDSGIARRHQKCREKSWCPLRTKQKDQPKTTMSLPCPFAPRNDGGGRGLPPSAAERRGRRSLRSEFHTPSGYWRPIERAQWCYSTTGLPERIVRGHWPQKIPPDSEEPGDFYQNCSTQYAERKLATGREVLLEWFQAKPFSHEFVRGHWPQQKDHPGGGWSFYPIPARGAGISWKRQYHPGALHPTQAL